MNPKLLAVKRTLYMLAVCALASLTVFGLISLVTAEQALYALGIAALVFCLWMMYTINLSRIQYEQTLKDIQQRESGRG